MVPRARVTAENASTGLTRAVETGDEGEYRLLLLPPGEYRVTAEKERFRPLIVRDVRVAVGQVVELGLTLEIGVARERVEVGAETPVIESERAHQANTLQREWIQNLPINRRDYLSYSLLAPGVADATNLTDNADFRLKQTPHSGLSFYGSNGRGNSFSVDGGEANDETGGVRMAISQEAVEEFQLNRANYAAEFGGATGGVVNIVTRSGGNAVHGSLFGFFRDDALDAGDPFARVLDGPAIRRVKPHSHRQQFGWSLGGPLRRDRTFFFAAGEGLIRNESSVVSLLTDRSIFGPTAAQETALGGLPAPVAAAVRGALTAPQSTVQLFERNSGVKPAPAHEWKFSARLDHRAGDRDHVFLRFSFSDLDERNANTRALIGSTRGLILEQREHTVAGNWTHTFASGLIHEAQAQASYRKLLARTVEPFGPEIRIQGFGVFNRDLGLPSQAHDRRYEFKDTVTWMRGAHVFKAGGTALVRDTNRSSEIFFGGRFSFGDLPGALLGIPGLPPDFSINGLQAFNLGIPQTFLMGAGDPVVASVYPFYGGFAQDSWKVSRALTLHFGLRYELDQRTSPIPLDKNNVAPRFSFAWNPGGSSRTVVRGGAGMYYSPHFYQIDFAIRALNSIDGYRQIAQVFTTLAVPGPTSPPNLFNTLRRQGVIGVPTPGRALRPDDLAQFGLRFNQTGPPPPLTFTIGIDPEFVNPYSQQASLSVERQIGADWSVSAEYTFVRTFRAQRGKDYNLLPAPVDPRLGIRVWNSPAYFENPLVGQRNLVDSTGRAFYSGGILEVRRRFNRRFTLSANYTLSRATDEIVDYPPDYQAFDQTNLRGERSLSSFHQKHKVAVFGSVTAPWGLQLSPIFRANSGRPFNLLAGFDLNQDRHDTTDRPAGAGRNTGLGPAFATFDLRVGRTLRAGERATVELTAEAFNLFNRLNLATVNNVVGNIAGPFNLSGRDDRTPSQPLGFTSAFDPRRIQLGARIRF